MSFFKVDDGIGAAVGAQRRCAPTGTATPANVRPRSTPGAIGHGSRGRRVGYLPFVAHGRDLETALAVRPSRLTKARRRGKI